MKHLREDVILILVSLAAIACIILTCQAHSAPLPVNYQQPALGYWKFDHVEKYMRLNQTFVTGRIDNAFTFYLSKHEDPGVVFVCGSDREAHDLMNHFEKVFKEQEAYANYFRNKNVLLVLPMRTDRKILKHYWDLICNLK